MKLLKNVDVSMSGPTADWHNSGWETCAAAAFDTVVFTGNWFAAYSVDSGATFQDLDPGAICSAWGETFCCDQIVVYVPRINAYIWVLQTDASLVLATASPDDLRRPSGPRWDTILLPAGAFVGGTGVDRPELGYSDNYLFLTVNVYSVGRVCLRIPLDVLYRGAIFQGLPGAQYFVATSGGFVYPVSNAGSTGRSVSLITQSTIRVWEWNDLTGVVEVFDVPLTTTIPDTDFDTLLPSGAVWLAPNSKIDWSFCSAAMSRNRIWITWPAGRKYSRTGEQATPYPHVGVAAVDVNTRSLDRQLQVWNPGFGVSWPAIAVNVAGDVGLSACIGGGGRDAQHAVLVLTESGPTFPWRETTSGTSLGAGGHYVSIREHHPNVLTWAATGFNQVNDAAGQATNHPHYVVFRPG